MPTTQRRADPLALRQTFMSILERAYAKLARKGQYIYDLRKLVRRPFFLRHVADYTARIREGADTSALLDGHELVGLEVEAFADRSSIPGRLYPTLDESHDREFAVESAANPLQLTARTKRDLPSLRAALEATVTEITTLKQLARSYEREIAAKESLDRHVGYVRPA